MEEDRVSESAGKWVKELDGSSKSRVREVEGRGSVFSKEFSLVKDVLELIPPTVLDLLLRVESFIADVARERRISAVSGPIGGS